MSEAGAGPRRGLGMGLAALLGTSGDAPPAGPVETVPIERLRPSPVQPRRRFSDPELEALAASIATKGVLQPLLVRPAGEQLEIVAGERRWRAAQRAGLHQVPVVVRELGDGEALELALVENLQRADLSPLEEAEALRRLVAEFGYRQETLAEALGRSRSHVANTLRLLGLPEPVRAMLEDGSLSAGHARALLAAADPQRLALQIVARGLNVRQTEALARDAQSPPKGGKVSAVSDAETRALEQALSAALGMKAQIIHKGAGAGQVTIRYGDLDQLDRLCEILTRPK